MRALNGESGNHKVGDIRKLCNAKGCILITRMMKDSSILFLQKMKFCYTIILSVIILTFTRESEKYFCSVSAISGSLSPVKS